MEKRTSSGKPVNTPSPPPHISGVYTDTYESAAKVGIFYSLKAKLLIFGLCISLIPIAIITTISYFNAGNALKQQIMQNLMAVAESKKMHILEFLEAKKGRTIDFCSDGFIRDHLEKINHGKSLRQDNVNALNRHLSMNKKPLDPHIAAIEVVDMDGKVVASTNETMIGRDVSGHEIYKRAIHAAYNNPYVSQPYHSTYLDAKSIDVSAPITSRRGSKIIGVLINHYYATVLNKFVANSAGMSASGEVLLVRKDGDNIEFFTPLMYAPDDTRSPTIPMNSAESRVARLALEGGSGVLIATDYRGVDVMAAYQYIPSIDWGLIAKIDTSETFAALKALGIIALIVSVVSAAVVASAGIIFAVAATRPIVRLTDATLRFAGGDLKARIAIIHRDEIGDLTKNFNTMADKLEKEITMHERRELELRKVSLVVEQSPNVVLITDTQGNIEYVNPMFTLLTGYTREEAIGKNPRILKSGKTPPERYKRLWWTITSGTEWRGEFCNKKKNGELYWESAFISSIKNAAGDITHFIAIAEDTTERRRAEERIQHLAYYDALTGMPNRAFYNDLLSLALSHAQRRGEMVAVLFLDLDRFKDVNDTLGHSIGDQLLKIVAGRVADSLRKEDTVTRLGGDEFTLLLPGMTQTEDAARIAQKILEAVKKPLMLGGHELNITASIGIAIYPADGENAEALLKNADTAMYHAKEQGRNSYKFFTPVLQTRTVEHLEVESSLHHALEREEFIVYYQPQVDIKTGRIVSSEALIRWQCPGRGLINPAEFIGMAERTGLIVPIGEWVLRTACSQNKAWQDAGLPPLLVAVNLSAHQFQQENLVKMVELVLKETGMDPVFLVLEVTESAAMKNAETANYMIKRLVGLGVHFVIDDLGTGYSSLSYLKMFPIHALKIDKSFVQDVVTDSNDAALVTAIISMAKGLKLKVVAEGVETTAQLEFLRSLGCDEAQGYLFGKPMPAGEFKKMLEQDKRLRV
ncbi:MAG: hypothetical protein A2Y11_03210 [Planctomycetes bacterium GWC2_39_26]|nr:MAG: hypothetical protein A2Y11_03210 [Planctomycetes bacterium GWC2_39_26]